MGRQIRTASSQFTFDTDEQAIMALEAEGRKLKYIAIKTWRKYLGSYKPAVYIRKRNSQKAIKLGRVKRIDAYTFGIEVTFDDGLSYHDSYIDKDKHKKGHSFMLISEGWKVRKGKHKDIRNFGYFEGIDYIGQVQRAYNAQSRKGVSLEVQWNGSEFKKQSKQKNVLK